LRAWLQVHGWKLVVPALGLGAAIGAFATRKPPPPAVDLTQSRDKDSHAKVEAEQRQVAGPVDVKRRWTLYGPGQATLIPVPPESLGDPAAHAAGPVPAAPCQVTAVLEEEEHRGPVQTDTKATTSTDERTRDRLDLRIRPVTPRYSLGLGMEDVLGARQPRISVRYRIGGLGPCANVWAEGSIRPRIDRPLESPVGAALACDVL
jgi:hypothetical protein